MNSLPVLFSSAVWFSCSLFRRVSLAHAALALRVSRTRCAYLCGLGTEPMQNGPVELRARNAEDSKHLWRAH